MDTEVVRRSDTKTLERMATIAAEIAGIRDSMAEIKETLVRMEAKFDESARDRATLNARQLSMQADIDRAHRKIEGVYGRIWGVVITSMTALIGVIWDFLRRKG